MYAVVGFFMCLVLVRGFFTVQTPMTSFGSSVTVDSIFDAGGFAEQQCSECAVKLVDSSR